jgi:hypothetical protein
MRVADKISWDSHKVALKAFLGIGTTAEDAQLEVWIDQAVQAADKYLCRDFVPYKYRWTFDGTLTVGDEVEVDVYSETMGKLYSIGYTTVTGDTIASVTRTVRDAIAKAVVPSEFIVTRAGPIIILQARIYDTTVDASCTVTSTDSFDVAEDIDYTELPKHVVAGVFAYVKAARNLQHRGHGVQAVTTGSLSESYWYAAGRSALAASDPTAAMLTYLRPYKLPTFAGRLP